MNISQLKAFLGDKPQHLGSENSVQNQLRDAGLKQALNAPNTQVTNGLDKFSSSTSLGLRIYSNSYNATLEINQQKPNFSPPENKEKEASLFDFEEVAKNVLNFIGGALKNAKNKGADDEELNSIFEQASSGVLQGIKLAEQDLAGFLNEEITEGINQSKALIDEGIANLRRDIFNPDYAEESIEQQLAVDNTSVAYEKLQSGELNIRTKDGDNVTLTFEDFQQFEFNQRQVQQLQEEVVSNESTLQENAVDNTISQSPADEASIENTTEDPVVKAPEAETLPSVTEQNAIFHQQNSLSFSVTGELDEEELQAIGQLVADTNDLAEEFFNGDIETAFNQALELGFDEQELSSFALQLTKVENTQVIRAYETVSRYDGENEESDPARAVKPVTEYLDKLLNVLDGSRQQLENNASYENVVNELINRLGDEVATPDLISAINRFNEFNQKLIDNLPIGFQSES